MTCISVCLRCFIVVCEYCGYNFDDYTQTQSKKRLRLPSHDQDDSHSDEHTKRDSRTATTTNYSSRPIDAVENAMNDDELKSYYEQYVKLAVEQRKSKTKTSIKELNDIIVRLFSSLQYKNEQSDG